MKKLLLIIALLVSGLGLNAQNEESTCPVPTGVKVKGEINVPDFGKIYKVTVSWDAVPEAELYAVYATSQYVPEPMWVGDVYDGTEWFMGSDLGGELYFYVRTICDAENMIVSELSEGVSVILSEDLETTVIEAPKNLTATVKDNSSIELTWDAAENAESYFVYRNGEEIANIKETTYLDENLKADTEYCYMVTTMGITEESDPSEEVCETIITDGVEEMSSSFNIYPNPVEDELFIATEMNVTEVAIYDIYGRKTTDYRLQTTDFVHSIDIADLEAGVYFVKVVTENGKVVKRFVKK